MDITLLTPKYVAGFRQPRNIDIVFDDQENYYKVSNFRIIYIMPEHAARDLDTWAGEQKEKRVKEKDIQPLSVADWYNLLNDAGKSQVKVIPMDTIPERAGLTEREKEYIMWQWQRQLPVGGHPLGDKKVTQYLEYSIYYSGNTDEINNSISSFYRQSIFANPEHRPTLAEWWDSLNIIQKSKFTRTEIKY